MSARHSAVCCRHGVPCITGNFIGTFDGVRLPELADGGGQSKDQQTAYTRSSTARSSSVSSLYEDLDNSKTHRNSSDPAVSRDDAIFGREGSQGHAVKVYIGIKSTNEAERIVTRPTDFKMYHRLSGGRDIDSLHPKLALYIVYRSTKNVARHIPIKTVVENKRRFLSVGTSGKDKRLLFESIDALVKYYKTYVQLLPQESTGMVDVFSS